MIKTFEQFVLENLNTTNELNIKRLKPYISKIVDTVKIIMDELPAAEVGGGGTISDDISLGGKMYTIAVDYDVYDEYFDRGEDNRYDDRYVAIDYGLTGFTVESGDYSITNEELGIKEPTHSDLFKVYTGYIKKESYHRINKRHSEQFESVKYGEPINEAFQSSKLREIIKQHGMPKYSFENKMLYDLKDNEIIDVLPSDEFFSKYSKYEKREEAVFSILLKDGYRVVISNLGILDDFMSEREKDKANTK